ncbi:hypothetical protein LS482_09770 [Sinomicrobium kalidii]|uniref:hypothetical protein n=1 Tax=Sinomicrobium kalidii TaxID=2900738 RepID=UPI001E6046BF|nr:hypothetical protein [Sinomicrobium kalidii]UGU18155.1 hypothetical protein LS482_09770 [Sinomicrobium kalidii]
MAKFNYKITILNALSYLYILGCLVYTIFKWEILSKEEGWGVVAMLGLISIGLIPLLIDLVLQAFIKKKTTLNIIGLLVAITIIILFLPYIKG